MYELGLTRLRDIFGLEPVEFPTTKKLGASKEEDLPTSSVRSKILP